MIGGSVKICKLSASMSLYYDEEETDMIIIEFLFKAFS